MRMKAARQMVVYTKDPLADIASAIGYGSVAPLVTHYRSAFGLSPSEDRRRINRFRVVLWRALLSMKKSRPTYKAAEEGWDHDISIFDPIPERFQIVF